MHRTGRRGPETAARIADPGEGPRRAHVVPDDHRGAGRETRWSDADARCAARDTAMAPRSRRRQHGRRDASRGRSRSWWRWGESNPRLPSCRWDFSERSRWVGLGSAPPTGSLRRSQPRCDVPPGHGARPGGEPLYDGVPVPAEQLGRVERRYLFLSSECEVVLGKCFLCQLFNDDLTTSARFSRLDPRNRSHAPPCQCRPDACEGSRTIVRPGGRRHSRVGGRDRPERPLSGLRAPRGTGTRGWSASLSDRDPDLVGAQGVTPCERRCDSVGSAGIELGAHWSVLVIGGLLAFGLSGGVVDGVLWAVVVPTVLLFLGSLLAHELGHSLVAQRNGMRVRGITLWMLGGVAQLEGRMPSAGAEFRIAAAGPAVELPARRRASSCSAAVGRRARRTRRSSGRRSSGSRS